MAVDADIENAIRTALQNAPEPRQLRTWCEKHVDVGIPCKFCIAHNLPCSAFSTQLRCKNQECHANSEPCSRTFDQLFSRVQEEIPNLVPNLARDVFDAALAKVRQKREGESSGPEMPPTPITLRIRRSSSMKAPYPSPRSSSTASDDAIDMVLIPALVKEKDALQTKVADTQSVVSARDETIKDLAEKLRRAQTQIKRNLTELEAFRRQGVELEGIRRKLSEEEALTRSLSSDKARLAGEVAEMQAKISDFEIENIGGAELFRELNAQVAALQAEKDTLQIEKDSLTNRMFQDLETVGTEKDTLLEERDQLLLTVDNLQTENDSWLVEEDAYKSRIKDLTSKTASLEAALKAEAEARQAERDTFLEEKTSLLRRMNDADTKASPASSNNGPLDNLRSENVTFLREKLALQAQVASIQAQYMELQKKYTALKEEKELKRNASSDNIRDTTPYPHAIVTQLQTELGALQMRYDEEQNDKQALAARVVTLQLQYDTLKELLASRNTRLDGGRDTDQRRASTSASTDGAELARLTEDLERTTDQLATCKRKLDGARKHVASVRTSYQRKFVLEHVAVVHLYENLSAALESSSAEHLRKAVKVHVKELRKLRGRLKEETPASVDVIMGMIMKQEEEDVGVVFDDEEEDGEGGQGGEESLDEEDREESTRPRKRPRPNPPLRPSLSFF